MFLAAGSAHEMTLITTMAAAFFAAWVLGIITQKFKLSPIVGYLLAGVAIGPHTPGFRGDPDLAPQLAEIGVMLLMFGVGLHFHLKDLLAVKSIAIPGAIGQSMVATLLGGVVAMMFGWSFVSGLVLGMAMAVASTVVLVRVLTDNRCLETEAGHVAVGWLIVEDILTVVVLVIIPALGAAVATEKVADAPSLWVTLPIALAKLAAFVAILMVLGQRFIPWVMVKVARLRSRELFTLTTLVMAITIAAAAYYIFGASMALGAFLAGMVVGRSPVSHQAAADAIPMRDAFAILFFASVGMIFNPWFILEQPLLLLAGLCIILIGKPLAALIIVTLIGHSGRVAILVAIALAQVGEFSFILSDLARREGLLGEDGHNLLVACSIVSITLNPMLFRLIPRIEERLQQYPPVWKFMNRRAAARMQEMNAETEQTLAAGDTPLAVIVGYGPVGRAVDALLHEKGMETVVIDMNMDTITQLKSENRIGIYGDAFNIEVLAPALERATHMVVSLPHSVNRSPLIASAKLIKPELKIYVRAHYVAEREELEQVGADAACYEEAEAAVALSRLVLRGLGDTDDTIRGQVARLRTQFNTHLPASPTM
jgi:monovalent cation:H+ antiporter-2, CPA2 family